MIEQQLSIDQLKRARYILNPAIFIKDLLGFEVKDFHKEWLDAIEKYNYLCLLAPRGHGKDQPLFSKVLTPSGWKQIGNIKVGDLVIGINGEPTKVVGVFPQGRRKYYKITTRSGRIAYSSSTHLWPVICPSNTGNKVVIKELREISKNYKVNRYDKRSNKEFIEYRYFLPNVSPINFSEKDLLIDPYTLGLWLGDGISDSGAIVTNDPEIFQYIPYEARKRKAKYIYGILGLFRQLKKLNLRNNKHIPDIYKFGSIMQREALLQGLLDSDGNNQSDGHVFEFNNKNKQLIDDVADIIRSLGGVATIRQRYTSFNGKKFKSYRITGKLPNNIMPFKLSRKVEGWKGSIEKRLKDAIVDISEVGETEAVCIKVDSEDGIYITDDYIPTHNTSLVGGYIVWKIITRPDIRILIVTVNQQKADEMMSIIKGNLESNEKIIQYFGDQKGGVWSTSQIRVKRAGWRHKEPTLQVLGLTSSQISSHYDLIILDDIVDDKNCATEHRRRAIISWYNNALMPMLEPGGSVIDIGTKWNASDIHAYLSDLDIYKTLKYKAIIREPTEENPDIEPKVLWPERFPYYDEVRDNKLIVGLKTIRDKHIGKVAFSLQYQNEIIQTEDSPIRMEWIEQSKERWDELTIPSNIKRYMGVDLASKSRAGDYFTITVIGVDEANNIYVLDSIRDHKTMAQQLELIKEMDRIWRPVKIAIESNAAQKIITDNWIDTTSLPIVQLKSSWINDKWSRVERLSVLFETGRIILKPTLVNLIDELVEFPRGKHDDSIDSLSFAIQVSENDEVVDWRKLASIITAKKTWNVSKI